MWVHHWAVSNGSSQALCLISKTVPPMSAPSFLIVDTLPVYAEIMIWLAIILALALLEAT